jgi:hypothetical protein
MENSKMELTNETLEQARSEINSVNFNRPSWWLEKVKASAIASIRTNNIHIVDDYDCCTMQHGEFVSFKDAIINEAEWHDTRDLVNLENRIVRSSKEYVDAWNEIIEILMKYDKTGRIDNKWLQTPVDSSVLIGEFCRYDLPADAFIDGSWDLPDNFINGSAPNAPTWDLNFPEFTAYIKSTSSTSYQDLVEVEYYVYKLNTTHWDGYYELWSTEKAVVNTKTHRRWKL